MREQTIDVPIEVGSVLTIFENVDMDSEGGFIADTKYEATVEQYVPQTRKLEMSDGSGYMDVMNMLEDADGVQIVKDDD